MNRQTDKPQHRRLRRSRTERIVFGVCGGLAEHFGVDPNLVRLAFVAVALVPPVSLLSIAGYLLLALLVTDEGAEHLPPRDALRGNLTALGAELDALVAGVGARIARLTGGRLPALDDPVPPEDRRAPLERRTEEAAAPRPAPVPPHAGAQR